MIPVANKITVCVCILVFGVSLRWVLLACTAPFAQQRTPVRRDDRPRAVLHVGPAKCASSTLQQFMYLTLRDDIEHDGFALPTPNDFPGNFYDKKIVANLAQMALGQADERTWSKVTQFFKRHHRDHKPLMLSSESFAVRNLSVPLLQSFLAPWNTHVVVVYRPFYDWVVSLHNAGFFSRQPWRHTSQPLTEWLTLDRMYGFMSDSDDRFLFSVGLRNKFLANGFNVTVLALNSSLIFDFFCGVVGASRTCQHLRGTPNITKQKQNARKTVPCRVTLCMLPDKLDRLLNLSVQLDGAMPVEVQRGESLLHEDFGEKVRSKYFCSCGEAPVTKRR